MVRISNLEIPTFLGLVQILEYGGWVYEMILVYSLYKFIYPRWKVLFVFYELHLAQSLAGLDGGICFGHFLTEYLELYFALWDLNFVYIVFNRSWQTKWTLDMRTWAISRWVFYFFPYNLHLPIYSLVLKCKDLRFWNSMELE